MDKSLLKFFLFLGVIILFIAIFFSVESMLYFSYALLGIVILILIIKAIPYSNITKVEVPTYEVFDPQKKLEYLLVRSGHYSRQGKSRGKRIFLFHRLITFLIFSFSAAIGLMFSLYQNDVIKNISFQLIVPILSFGVSFLSIIQTFFMDRATGQKFFSISIEFNKIHKEVERTLDLHKIRHLTRDELYISYDKLEKEYKDLQEKYVEHIYRGNSYYKLRRMPGKIRPY